MEEPTPPVAEPRRHSNLKPIVLALLAIILIVAAGAGVYLWQHSKVKNLATDVANLQNQLKAQRAAPTASKSSPQSDSFTYKSFGMTLSLPKTYGIIVKVEGNKGGAPGATYRVASVKSADSNVFADADYQGVQIDIDNTFTTLDHAVSSEESRLDEQRAVGSIVDRNYKVSDTTVAGLPAKLLTAEGLDEYEGNVSVYLVGSGSFTYSITANSVQGALFPLLESVLKGIVIKPTTL